MFAVPIVPVVELQTPFGSAIPPAPGHPPEYAVTTHIPMWETVAQFAAKVADIFEDLLCYRLILTHLLPGS